MSSEEPEIDLNADEGEPGGDQAGGRRGRGGGRNRRGRNRRDEGDEEEEDDDDEEEEDDDDDDDDDSEEEEDPMASLPSYIVKRVEKLQELNTERDEIMEQYLVERAALEQKYLGLCRPLYDQRATIIRGEQDEEIAAEGEDEEKEEAKNDQDNNDDDEEGERARGIPQFWVCAMGHMEQVAELLTEEDVDCLEHLLDIKCLDDPEGSGFTLEFHFAPNDYFENTILTKRYEVPNLLLEDEPVLKNVVGCKIHWKSGRSLMYRQVTKKQRGKGKNAGQVRTIKKRERRDSFFHFFDPPKMPSMDEMDEDEADRLEEAFDNDYDVAQAFRTHIIPKGVLWFTGQALEDDEDDDDDEEESDDDDDEEDEMSKPGNEALKTL